MTPGIGDGGRETPVRSHLILSKAQHCLLAGSSFRVSKGIHRRELRASVSERRQEIANKAGMGGWGKCQSIGTDSLKASWVCTGVTMGK